MEPTEASRVALAPCSHSYLYARGFLSKRRNQCFPGGVSEPPALNKRILNSFWFSGVSEWYLCTVIARVPTCLLRVRLSQQIHIGEQRENKHTNLETAWESHGNNRQEEKKKLMRRWIFAAGQGGPRENPEKL